MKRETIIQNKVSNLLHTALLLAVMAVITGMSAYMVAGSEGIWAATLLICISFIFTGHVNTGRMLRFRGARPLNVYTNSQLYTAAEDIAKRAGLSRTPRLYLEHSKFMNAYATGTTDTPVIVLTDTLLRNLSLREISGILGHEVAHIRNNDLSVMNLANKVRAITSALSALAQITILLAIPGILSGQVTMNPAPFFFIMCSPSIVMMLQLALARTREFEADLVSCELTGDPTGLAQALYRLEQYHRYHWRNLIIFPWTFKIPSWLQTHPPTGDRIKKIMGLGDAAAPKVWAPVPEFNTRFHALRHPLKLKRTNCLETLEVSCE